jgi:hypothetical protein
MKAERRHELKTNTLAEAVMRMPDTGKRNTITMISIILAGLLIGLLIRYRLSASQERLVLASDNLAVAREDIDLIKRMTLQAVDPSQPQEWYRDALTRLDSVLTDVGSSNPAVAAEALVARGDAAWYMKDFDASTTQPTVGQSTSELLGVAESAYKQVLSAYPSAHFSTTAAHIGLGTIAEDRHDWTEARKQYQAIIDDADAGDVMQSQAKQMLRSVDDLEHPPVIAAATQPATLPTFDLATQPIPIK